jgi:hypothetical protein
VISRAAGNHSPQLAALFTAQKGMIRAAHFERAHRPFVLEFEEYTRAGGAGERIGSNHAAHRHNAAKYFASGTDGLKRQSGIASRG